MTDFAPNLSSPKDWPENWQELRVIDNLLRCSICAEFFTNTSIIPSCSHNYCSLCIRRYLSFESKCPSCSVCVKDSQLENNRIMDEIVKSFCNLRQKLLKVLNENTTDLKNIQDTEKPKNTESDYTRSSRFFTSVAKKDSMLSPKASQKRQRKIDSSASDQSSSNGMPSPILRKRLKRPSYEEKTDDSSDDEISIIEKPTSQQSPATTSNKQFLTIKPKIEKEDSVDCPVCNQKVTPSKINTHLDTCLTSKNRKENLRSSSQSSYLPDVKTDNRSSPVGANSLIPNVTKRKPLNKLVYTLLSDKQLKQRLKEYGLSVKGDKQTLIKRHQEFTILYNSECSKARPKSVTEIVRLVEEGEKKKKKLNHGREKLNFEHGQSQEDIDKIKDDYMSQNKDEFTRLINQIKNRKQKGVDKDNESTVVKSTKKQQSVEKPTKKKHNLVIKKRPVTDDETGSNSSTDFEITDKKFNTPQRKLRSSGSAEKRWQTRSSAKKIIEESSGTTSEQSEIPMSEKDSDQTKVSSVAIPNPPSPSLLKNLDSQDGQDLDQNSSDSETLMPAFGPSSPVAKEIQATPPDNNYESDELEF